MEFNVRPVARICASTGKELTPGRPCWSVLVQQEGQLVRLDYSAESWTGPPEDVVGYWECIVPVKPSATSGILDLDALFDYFLQLSETPNTAEEDYLYVVALLLMRKRRLILEETIETDDQSVLRLFGAGGEGPFDVVERDLSDERIAELQNQLLHNPAA